MNTALAFHDLKWLDYFCCYLLWQPQSFLGEGRKVILIGVKLDNLFLGVPQNLQSEQYWQRGKLRIFIFDLCSLSAASNL
jgi:hypothetical protein